MSFSVFNNASFDTHLNTDLSHRRGANHRSLVVKLKLPCGSFEPSLPKNQPDRRPTTMSNTPMVDGVMPDFTFDQLEPSLSGRAPTAQMMGPTTTSYELPECWITNAPQQGQVEAASTYRTRHELERGVAGANRPNPPHAFVEDAEETEGEQPCNNRTTNTRQSSNKRQKRKAAPTTSDNDITPEDTYQMKVESLAKNFDLIVEITLTLQAAPKDWMKREMVPKVDGKPQRAYEWSYDLLHSILVLSRLEAGNLQNVSEGIWKTFQDRPRKRREHVVAEDVKLTIEKVRKLQSANRSRGTNAGHIQDADEEPGLETRGQQATTQPLRTELAASSATGLDGMQAAGALLERQQHEAVTSVATNIRVRPSQEYSTGEETLETRAGEPRTSPRNDANHPPSEETGVQRTQLPDQSQRVQATAELSAHSDAPVHLAAQDNPPADTLRDMIQQNGSSEIQAWDHQPDPVSRSHDRSRRLKTVRWGSKFDFDEVEINFTDGVFLGAYVDAVPRA